MSERDKTFGERLIEGMEEAVAFRRGELQAKVRRRTSAEPSAPLTPPVYTSSQIQSIRQRMGVSQVTFARVLNVSPATVRAWEQGLRRPSGPALRLLELAETNPSAITQVSSGR